MNLSSDESRNSRMKYIDTITISKKKWWSKKRSNYDVYSHQNWLRIYPQNLKWESSLSNFKTKPVESYLWNVRNLNQEEMLSTTQCFCWDWRYFVKHWLIFGSFCSKKLYIPFFSDIWTKFCTIRLASSGREFEYDLMVNGLLWAELQAHKKSIHKVYKISHV